LNKLIELSRDDEESRPQVEPYTEDEKKSVAKFLKGSRRLASEETRDGSRNGEEGKRHLPVDEYRKICIETLSSLYGRHPSESHLLVNLAWNLCGRADTVTSVHARHIDWEADALIIGISKSKRNEKETLEPFRVYANPYEPEVCPILALALHIACYGYIFQEGTSLFHKGNDGESSLSREFQKICTCLAILELGLHSIRKGALTKALTGTPDSVPTVTVVRRARWSAKEFSVILR